MTNNKHSIYKISLITALLGLFFSPSFAFPRKNIFDSLMELSAYGFLLGAAVNSFDMICQRTPDLYDNTICDEEYLQFVEERIDKWKFFLTNPNETELASLRIDLIQYYKQVLSKRSTLSLIFERAIPYQPWALLNVEIQQHINRLSSSRSSLFRREFTTLNSKMLSHEQTLQFFDRIQKVEDLLKEIVLTLKAYPSFQSECSQARLEEKLSSLARSVFIFLGFYFAHQQGKYLDKYCH